MSIKRNTLANYIGQAYTSLISVVMLPLYLSSLGAEGYGLVGFFAVMQAWLGLLDIGLSPTLSRQVAHLRGRSEGLISIWPLLRSIEWIFGILSILIASCVWATSSWMASTWLKIQTLEHSIVINCIVLMGLMIGMRWFGALYRGGIQGMEKMVWLNAINVAIATLRFVGAYILLQWFSNSIEHFFQFQLAISILELFLLANKFYHLLPKRNTSKLYFKWQPIKEILPFTTSITYSSLLWVLITQTDKIILSGVLELNEFGYFSLITLICSSITLISNPISQAIIPRMTNLVSQGKTNEMLSLYRKSSQLVVLISFSVALIIGLYSEELIYAWTGDAKAAKWGSNVLLWFALGNGILSIGAFQYYLQNSFGELRLHVIGSTISTIIQVPLIYYSATIYGASGAGMVWFAFRTLWFIFWTPVVHAKFIPGFHLNWLLKDILPIIISIATLSLTTRKFINFELNGSRFYLLLEITLVGFFVLLFASITIKPIRIFISNQTTTLLKHL